MIKFYFAASYSSQAVMRDRRTQLEAMGHTVTARWLDSDHVCDTSPEAIHEGNTDLEDIDTADVVVCFTDVPSTTGGLHVEYGYALACSKTIAVVGPINNIFQNLATFKYPDWETFLVQEEATI